MTVVDFFFRHVLDDFEFLGWSDEEVVRGGKIMVWDIFGEFVEFCCFCLILRNSQEFCRILRILLHITEFCGFSWNFA